MFAALLETLGAMSVLVSVAAKIAWLRAQPVEVREHRAAIPRKRRHEPRHRRVRSVHRQPPVH